jgi:hypothetical protein
MDDDVIKIDSAPILQNWGDELVRRRLGPAAWKGFCRIMAAWQVPAEESRQLLALQPAIRVDEQNSPELNEEQLFRISNLIGIYKALHILHNDKLADEWVKLPNTNVMFSGQPPLSYMILGGVQAMRNVRKLLDARCAGNG